jgi:hypothetical protein
MMLSFTLNPLTNALEFVIVPQIDFQQSERPKTQQSKPNAHEDPVRNEGLV